MKSFALAIAAVAASQARADPADLRDFGLVCFCNSRVGTPHHLVEADNNGRILLLARSGVTKAELAAQGAAVSESQLQALVDWGLLEDKDGRLTTAFPILGSADMARLRARLSPIADRVERAAAPDLTAIRAALRSRDQERSAEAVLFAYALDGLTWEALGRANALPSQQIDVAHPYWSGTFWAVYPKQDNMPGTNSRRISGSELRMMWTPPVLSWFGRLTETPPDAAVIDETAGDPIYVQGQKAAQIVATAVLSAKLDDVIPSANSKQRVLIATHELIWMLLDRANSRLGFSPPTVLRTGAKSLQEITPLIVIVRGGRP